MIAADRAAAGQKPPCIVLGIDTQIGVAIIRELGRLGVRVIGLANAPRAIGLRSRYLAQGIVVGRQRDERLLERLRTLGAAHGGAVLLPIAERDIGWLIEHREDLDQTRLVAPTAAAFREVTDKARTLARAAALGIRVPRTVAAASLADWHAAAARMRYPVVVKWADPPAVSARLRAHGLTLNKLEYAHDADSLRRIGERFVPVGCWPLLQEYCPGYGLGQFFFVHRGDILRRFQHRRIAEWPPEGGFSSVCDAVPLALHRDLQEQSIALLRALDWEGVAMVEYRYDPTRATAALMEINGRFWGSFPLAVHAGAGFASLAYHVQGLGERPELPPLREKLRCRMVSTEVKRLLRLLLAPGKIADPYYPRRPGYELARFVLDFVRPEVCYFLWSRDDPGPFWADLRAYATRWRAQAPTHFG